MAKSKNKPWTEEEIQLLQKYHNEGISYEEIAEKLGRTKISVKGKANFKNSCSNFKIIGKWTEDEKKLLQKYYEEGYSYKEIADKLNRTHSSVYSYIDRFKNKKSNNLNNYGKKWTKDEEELLLQYYNEGMKNKEIAKKLERSLSSISIRLRFILNENVRGLSDKKRKEQNSESKKVATSHRKSWTKEEELRLKEYIEKGYSYSDISKILGRTIVSVQTRYLKFIKEDKENG